MSGFQSLTQHSHASIRAETALPDGIAYGAADALLAGRAAAIQNG